MNERIEQLAKEAGYAAPEMAERMNRFAELMAGDFIELVRDVLRDEDSPLTYAAASALQAKIRQTYGLNL